MERQRMSRGEASSPTNRVTEHLREGYDSATECVANHPTSSVLVMFGVGFGIGLLLGHALAEPPPDERTRMARFGHQVLETMRQYMPDAIASRLRA